MDGTLKFDDRTVDTKLAEAYLKKHDIEFHSIGVGVDCDSKDHVFDKAGNKIFYYDDNFDKDIRNFNFNFNFQNPCESITSEMRKQMRALAMKIDENGELFAQLEALIRKKSKDDVKNFDIKLISQNFLHCSQNRLAYRSHSGCVVMEENKGLFTLGMVAQILTCNGRVCIVSDKETAAVCYLFTELCHQVGLQLVTLKLKENNDNNKDPPKGMGIITNNCDVESAVDTFLFSSTKYPWSLRRILIQESVYGAVKEIFAWKCKNSTTEATLKALDPSLKQSSTEVFLYDDKLLMLDFVGDHEQIEASQHIVLIEAYRTNRELMSLIKTQDPFSISLWCINVAEANEIAFGADVNMVWVNDFAVFDGPPAASQAVFFPLILKDIHHYNILFKQDELLKVKTWSELSVRNRIMKITKALEEFKIENNDEGSIRRISESEFWVSRWKSENFVDVQKDKHYIGRVFPIDIVYCTGISLLDPLSDMITSLINGQGIVYETYTFNGPVENLVNFFEKEPIPAFIRNKKNIFDTHVNGTEVKIGLNLSRTRVVCTSFGTIFAN